MSDAHTDGRPLEAVPRATDFAALFERSPDPMVAVDGEDVPTVRVVNDAYRRTFSSGGLDDRTGFRGHVDLTGVERSVVRTAAAGSVGRDAVTKRTSDGRRTFALEAVPASHADVTAFLRYRDVTHRRVRDQQLAVLRRVLRHDLRNDLTVVLGYARTVAETAADDETRRAADTIVESARNLRTIAESAGRLESVTGSTPRPTELGTALARVRRSLEESFPGEVTVDGGASTTAVDGRVGIALEELVRTLVDQGGASELRISARVEAGDARVVVDSDASLSDQQRSALEGRAETQLRHATGICPWTARWAVECAGGGLRVERATGERTRISLTVPELSDDGSRLDRGDSRIAR